MNAAFLKCRSAAAWQHGSMALQGQRVTPLPRYRCFPRATGTGSILPRWPASGVREEDGIIVASSFSIRNVECVEYYVVCWAEFLVKGIGLNSAGEKPC